MRLRSVMPPDLAALPILAVGSTVKSRTALAPDGGTEMRKHSDLTKAEQAARVHYFKTYRRDGMPALPIHGE